MQWADIVVPIGGDGTFLLAASRACPLFYNKKPVIGFNSDPDRSEGRLMLPKEYSSEPKEAVQKLINVSSFIFQIMRSTIMIKCVAFTY